MTLTEQDQKAIDLILAEFSKMPKSNHQPMITILKAKALSDEMLLGPDGHRLDKAAKTELARRFEALVNGN